MFTFHEGLPRSGKSYECVVKQIIPAIKKGRRVYAYVAGLNHELIASLCDITTEQCKDLLIQVEEDQVTKIYEIVKNDSLVIIDELQDFFPSGRQKLSPEMTKFVTQHGHDGLDIIGMGQSLLDCHNIWRRRCQRKIIFTKLDMVGMEERYTWEMYSGKATNKDIKFVKINSGTAKYEKKYFGTYKSHTDDTLNTENLQDDRSNIFKTKGFRFGLPAAIIVGIVAINHLVNFFSEPQFIQEKQNESVNRENIERSNNKSNTATIQTNNAKKSLQQKRVNVVGKDQTSDYVEKLANLYRFRLGGYIEHNSKIVGYVQVYDDTFHLKELFTFDELRGLSWEVKKVSYGVLASKDQTTLVIRSWPLESFGKVSKHISEQL